MPCSPSSCLLYPLLRRGLTFLLECSHVANRKVAIPVGNFPLPFFLHFSSPSSLMVSCNMQNRAVLHTSQVKTLLLSHFLVPNPYIPCFPSRDSLVGPQAQRTAPDVRASTTLQIQLQFKPQSPLHASSPCPQNTTQLPFTVSFCHSWF